MPCTGAPASSPCAIASWIPLSTAGPEALRDDAADDLVDELVARRGRRSARARSGSRRTGPGRRSASCTRWRARDAERMVSRYGTRGWCSSTSTPNRRLARSTRDLDVHLRSSRRGAARPSAGHDEGAGSGPPRRVGLSAVATFSSSPLIFGVTAKLITGSGKPKLGGSTVDLAVGEEVARLRRPSASPRRRCRPPRTP